MATDIHPFLANLLRKDQADSTPYTLSVAPAAAMSNVVTKAEIVGGVLRPYRLFSPVGATPVGANVRAGQNATITDSLGLGMAYKITKIQVQTISAPTLLSTITIKNGSTTVFTQNVALAAIPAVGKVLDLLTLAAAMPANLTLPATLTCTASSGSFEVFLDGVLV
jgi:hypothetical protein